MTKIEFTLNGQKVVIEADPSSRLLDVLRGHFGLTGPKEGCGEGECGACAVLVNDKLITSCTTPVASVIGTRVDTIEGIRETPRGKIIIDSFAEGGAVQCGFCIPGIVMAVEYLLRENPCPSELEIRQGISGNICRCTGYDLIVISVQLAATKIAEEGL